MEEVDIMNVNVVENNKQMKNKKSNNSANKMENNNNNKKNEKKNKKMKNNGEEKKKKMKNEKENEKKTNEKKENKKQSKGDGLRTFKLADPLIVYRELHGKVAKSKDPKGKYTDLTPGGAARKMFRRIARSRQLDMVVKDGKTNANGTIQKITNYSGVFKGADKNVVFSIIELDDDGSEVKRFYYKGSNKLNEPIMNKFIGFNLKTGKKKTSIQWVLPSIHAISKEEYESKIKNQL